MTEGKDVKKLNRLLASLIIWFVLIVGIPCIFWKDFADHGMETGMLNMLMAAISGALLVRYLPLILVYCGGLHPHGKNDALVEWKSSCRELRELLNVALSAKTDLVQLDPEQKERIASIAHKQGIAIPTVADLASQVILIEKLLAEARSEAKSVARGLAHVYAEDAESLRRKRTELASLEFKREQAISALDEAIAILEKRVEALTNDFGLEQPRRTALRPLDKLLEDFADTPWPIRKAAEAYYPHFDRWYFEAVYWRKFRRLV